MYIGGGQVIESSPTKGPDSDGRKYHLGQLHSFKASGAGVGGIRGRVCRGVWSVGARHYLPDLVS